MTSPWAVAGVALMAMGAVGVQADHDRDIPEIPAMTSHVRIGAAIESQESFMVVHRSDLIYIPE